MTVVSLKKSRPVESVPVKRNTSRVEVATDGAMKVALALFAPVRLTGGPEICVTRGLVIVPLVTAPPSVTTLPPLV